MKIPKRCKICGGFHRIPVWVSRGVQAVALMVLGAMLLLFVQVAGAKADTGRGIPTPPSPPHAITVQPAGWGNWLMPTGTICIQAGTQTTWPAYTVAKAWNATDATVVAKASCKGYARSMTVMIVSYSSSTDGYCAKTGSSNGFRWTRVRGVMSFVPNAPTIYINQWSRIRSYCQHTAKLRLNILMHEFGHVLGLAHATGVTIMLPTANERYLAPTVYDVARVNRRY